MIGPLFFVAMLAVIVAASLGARSARLRVVEEAFRALGGDPRRTIWGIEGPLHGLTVSYAVASSRRNNVKSTICTATLSIERPAFEMDLRPETRWGARDVEHGRAIDLVLGDDAFDDAFLVEAAPADVARALLDRDTRTALLAFHPCRMTVLGNELRFSKTAVLDNFVEVHRVLELVTEVRSRLESLPALLHEERLALARGESAGYRGPSPRAIGALATSSHAAGELAALRAMRVRRTMLRSAQAAAVVALGIIMWMIATGGHR